MHHASVTAGGPSFGAHKFSPPQREALRPVDTVSSSNDDERDSFEYEEETSYMMARSVKDSESRSKALQPSDSLSNIPHHDRDLNIRKRSSKVNSSATESKVATQREGADVKRRNPSPHPSKGLKPMKTLEVEAKKIPSLNLKHKALKSRYSSNSHSRKASSDDTSERNVVGAKENSRPSKSQRPRSKSASKKKQAKQQTSFQQASEPQQPPASTKAVRKPSSAKRPPTKPDASLIQQLLTDITEKYNKSLANSNCYGSKIEKKTMVHEINTLAKALIKSEKKYLKMQDSYRRQLKDARRALKDQETERIKLEQENLSLADLTKQLKSSTEHLMQDLVKQQRLTKDSIRAFDTLNGKYESDKRELLERLERDKDEVLRKEDHKHA